MRLGIVTDVHDDLARLRQALAHFEASGIDRVLTLGDLAETLAPGEPGAEAAKLLASVHADGVWGNHDFGLSVEPDEPVRAFADAGALRFTSRLRPFLVLGECRFSHVEPWRDATSVYDLWAYDGKPCTPAAAAPSFAGVPERLLFVGHFHRWFAVTPGAALDWNGERPLALAPPERFFVGLGAVCDGWCAVLDTDRLLLEPVPLA